MKFAIIKERKNPPDKRAVLSPEACATLKKKFPSSDIKVESDTNRAFSDEEYRKFGLEKEVVHPKVVERELMEYQEADYISIPSHYVKETFVRQGIPAAKLIQTPYGVDLSNFHPVPKQDKIFRIIHCGALNIRKGIPYKIIP